MNEKYKKVHSLQACKPCKGIPVHASKVMCGQPQLHENTNLVASHTTECLRSIRNSYGKIVEEHSHAPSHKIRSFLLKTDWDTHRLKDWWQCRSSHQQAYHYYDVMYQNSNWGHSENKHKRSKKDKNSHTSYYHVHINTDAFIQTYKICSVLREKP